VSWRATLWSRRSRMSERLPCRSSVPCPRRFRFAMACRVEWTVSGQIRPGGRCPKPCPIVASMVDAGHDRADIGQGPGLRRFRHRARVQVSRRTGPDAGSGWGCRREHPRCRPVRSGPGRAGRVVGRGRLARGMVGRTLGAGGVRRLAAAVRTGSRPIGWAVTLNWGCPADRTLESSAMSVTRPATAGCPQEELIGGDGVRASVRRPHPGGSGRPDGLLACPAGHGEVLEVPTGRSRVRRGPTSGSGAKALLAPSIGWTEECGAGWVGGSRQALPVRRRWRAGRGSARRRVVPGG
jgi:hypothetical protein